MPMMYGARPVFTPPKLEWDTEWPYRNARPDPISIGMARIHLADAFMRVDCHWDTAAGDHGYAWMVEERSTWLNRKGTGVVAPPAKPTRPPVGSSLLVRAQFDQDRAIYRTYAYLVEAGTKKLIEWFGKDMFESHFVKGFLPAHVTPRDLLEHLTEIYAKPEYNHLYMKQVKAMFRTPFNPKGMVEAYFFTLQRAQTHAGFLDQPFTPVQLMNQALTEFEVQIGRDASEAKMKWIAKPTKDKSWSAFKDFWCYEIHRINFLVDYDRRRAHQAPLTRENDMASVTETLNAAMREANHALALNHALAVNNALVVANHALEAEVQNLREANRTRFATTAGGRSPAPGTPEDMCALLDQLFECMTALRTPTSPTTSTVTNPAADRAHTRASTNSDSKIYKHLNDGKGKLFASYCWRCGCNCTHWTRKCLFLSPQERKQYRDTSFDNRLNGSSKFLERRGKYQSEFEFDSL